MSLFHTVQILLEAGSSKTVDLTLQSQFRIDRVCYNESTSHSSLYAGFVSPALELLCLGIALPDIHRENSQ